MYENFINNDLNNSCSNMDNKQNTDKKRPSECTEEPEKKKSKHSRSRSKSTKSMIEAVIPPEKPNPHIPIVRIKRKFNHDRSCSSHSVEKVSVDEHPKDYETVVSQADSELMPEPDPEPEPKIEISPEPEVKDISHVQNDSLPIKNVEIKLEEPVFHQELPHMSNSMPIPDTVNLMDNVTKQMQNPSGSEEGCQVPNTLEELLEKQWVQTSNFLMEQAQHFDIASMISCLHQLQSENNR
ncbi:hypothetical protein X975_13249, partial [Stegodyphus mimosarum]